MSSLLEESLVRLRCNAVRFVLRGRGLDVHPRDVVRLVRAGVPLREIVARAYAVRPSRFADFWYRLFGIRRRLRLSDRWR